jgi:hypothetical protein
MKMLGKTICTAVVTLASLVPPVLAQTVTMDVTNLGNNILGGVYVGPYYATVGNQTNVPIICDDFYDATSANRPWQATVSTVDQNSSTWLTKKLHLSATAEAADYEEAAYLAEQLVSPTVTCPSKADCAGDIQFAIWNIFDPSASNGRGGYRNGPLSYIGGSDLSNAVWWIQKVTTLYQQHALSTVQFSNVTVYSPYPAGPPQEFLRVNTAEAPALAALCADLLVLAAGAFLLRRKMAIAIS